MSRDNVDAVVTTPLVQSRQQRQASAESASSAEARSINAVMEEIPMGKFQYRLLVICGLSFMADAMEVSLLSFMSPCVGDEWNLSDNEIAIITSTVFAGILLGSLFWGPFADYFGRRRAFLWGGLVIIVGGFFSAFCTNYTTLVLFRALVGFGVGGITVPFDLLAEFLPNTQRGRYLMYIEYFWTIGSLFVAAAAWVCLSAYGWRVLTIITAIPVTIGLIFSFIYLPESPRWLLAQGKAADAAAVLQIAASFNNAPLSAFTLQPLPATEEVKIYDFITPAQLPLTLPLWSVWLGFGFTYYGVILFVARLFKHNDGDSSCDFDYDQIFLSAVAEYIGVTVALVVIDRWGRVSTQVALYVGAAVSVFCMGLSLPTSALTVVSILARFTAMGAASATWVATPELYNTQMRATAHAIANSISHLGGFLCPFLIDSSSVSVQNVGITLAVVNVVAAACAFLLPETLGADLDDMQKLQERRSRSNSGSHIDRFSWQDLRDSTKHSRPLTLMSTDGSSRNASVDI